MIISNDNVRSHIGKQFNSKKRSAPTYKIGTSTREGNEKVGCFKDTMTMAPVSIRLPHPKL